MTVAVQERDSLTKTIPSGRCLDCLMTKTPNTATVSVLWLCLNKEGYLLKAEVFKEFPSLHVVPETYVKYCIFTESVI